MLGIVKTAFVSGVALWLLSQAASKHRGARAWGPAVLALALLLMQARTLTKAMLPALMAPPEWDFMCFWTWGRMAVQGLDFYDPQAGLAFASGHSDAFLREVLAVGFWYPPPSMLLLVPLGYFEPSTALTLWYAFQLACLGGALVVFWRVFSPHSGWLARASAQCGLALVFCTDRLPPNADALQRDARRAVFGALATASHAPNRDRDRRVDHTVGHSVGNVGVLGASELARMVDR